MFLQCIILRQTSPGGGCFLKVHFLVGADLAQDLTLSPVCSPVLLSAGTIANEVFHHFVLAVPSQWHKKPLQSKFTVFTVLDERHANIFLSTKTGGNSNYAL